MARLVNTMKMSAKVAWLLTAAVGCVGTGTAIATISASEPYHPEATLTAVHVVRYDWHDAKRDRQVPVKLYVPETGDGPYPVILFSHGLGGTREGYEYLGRHWASRGYVSVHLQHLGSDDAVWREAAGAERMKALRAATLQPGNVINRPLDVSFAIDQLEKLNREASPFQRKLDLNRIGVAGHSFGAFTTLAVAGQVFTPGPGRQSSLADPRVKAAIPMSAPAPADKRRLDEVYGRIKIPCLHMTGTKDYSPIGDTQPEQRRLPFDHSQGSDQYLITFQEGDHAIFSGRGRLLPRAKDARFQELICSSSTAFWDACLRGDAKAKTWLLEGFKGTLGADGKFEVKLKAPPTTE
jgi:dienelactone hydrolase